MADGPAQNSFENLTQSGLIKINSKDDKNIALDLGAYGGITSFTMFRGPGSKPWKVNLKRKSIANLVILLRKMRNDPKPCREPIMLNQYDPEQRKFKQTGQIGIGIDESLEFYIDIASNDFQGRHVFPFKQDGNFDFSNTSLTDKEKLEGMLDFLIAELTVGTLMAERLSSFKRQGGPGGKGNFGGGGGNRNYGNNNNGGGNNFGGNNQSFGGNSSNDNSSHTPDETLFI